MILVTSDPHFSANPRDAYRFVFLTEILPRLLKEYNVETLYLLGDLCEQKDEHSAVLVNAVTDGLRLLSNLVEIVYLMGNHDFQQSGHPFFKYIRHFGIRYVTKPTKIGPHLFLPHTRTPEKDWKDLPNAKMIFTHVAFKGVKADSGYELDGIDPALLPDVPIISGDIHRAQSFDNITYVGAPYSVDFGDQTDGRVLLLENNKTESVFVGGPQKRVVRFLPTKSKWDGDFYPGDVVRVEVPLKSDEYARWGEIKASIQKWAVKNELYLDTVIADIKKVQRPAKEIKRSAPMHDEQVIDSYGKIHNIDAKTIAVGKEFL